MSEALNYFGRILIDEVRDRTIYGFDMRVTGKMRDESSQKLYKEISKMNSSELQVIEKIIPQIVDLCMHNMLCMLEEHDDIQVKINNEDISDISDGLAGELYTEDGWIQRFTTQRYEEI